MPFRYNINPLKKDFDLTEKKSSGPVGEIDWGEIGGTLSDQTDLQNALNNKVNDTGDTMTGDLSFTNAGINNANQITFNTSATETISEGVMSYNSSTGNLELGLAGGNVAVGLGKELVLPRRVKNSSGTTMTKGTVVYISGVDGNTPVVSRAIANSDATSAFTIGVCAESINDGNTGWILTNGLLAGYDFSTYSVGDILYLSGTNAGEFTTTKPQAPTHYVRIGEVVKATASGEAIITILNGYELDELHNVQINSVQTGQILQYQTDGLWKNVTLSGVITQHNDLQGIQGGTTNQYYHLTNSELTTLQATSGTNTGDVTVIDTTSLDLTLSGQILQGNVIPSAISHNSLGDIQTGFVGSGQFFHLTEGQYLNVQNMENNLVRKDLVNSTLTGSELTFAGNAQRSVIVGRNTIGLAGQNLLVQAGGARFVSSNQNGGNLILRSGTATGSGSADITFLTTTAGTSGTTDRGPTQKMVIKGDGKVGIGTTSPTYNFQVAGTGYFTSDLLANNLSGNNTGDQIMPFYGDGSDGLVLFDGTDGLAYATFDSGTATYTLTRDVYGTGVIVQSGYILKTAGYRIFGNEYITVTGDIECNGGNASGTTAGTGATAGFFKAGGNGGAGRVAGDAGIAGVAPATPTANTWVGGFGGRGGPGRTTLTTQHGGMISNANATIPANSEGGVKVIGNINSYLNKYIVSATNWQLTPSIGGGSGAKSATGTSATTGGGGGGGGIVFLAAPVITGVGTVYAKGGNGGNAAGTGGSFGGGGGGGGGIICYVCKNTTSLPNFNVDGGTPGTSVIGTNGDLPLAFANGTAQGTTTTLTVTPTALPSHKSLIMLGIHVQNTGGVTGLGINSIKGFGASWSQVSGSRIEFNTNASPTRFLELWYCETTSGSFNLEQEDVVIEFSGAVTNARVIIDEIVNTDAINLNSAVTGNSANNSVDTALTLTVTLPNAPTAGNMVYSLFGKSNAQAQTAGAGNTLVNNQSAQTPSMASEVSIAQQANAISHTTTNAAIGGISVEITATSASSTGNPGWAGKIVRLYG